MPPTFYCIMLSLCSTVISYFQFYFIVISPSTFLFFFFFLMIRQPPRSTLDRSSAASDVYKRQDLNYVPAVFFTFFPSKRKSKCWNHSLTGGLGFDLSLIHISEPTRPY